MKKNCDMKAEQIENAILDLTPMPSYLMPRIRYFPWETDVLAVHKTGRMTGYEIKVSRGDYRADQKKFRHTVLLNRGNIAEVPPPRPEWKAGIEYRKELTAWNTEWSNIWKWNKYQEDYEPWYGHARIPNQFYYVVPEGLVQRPELPKYAGLIYVNEKGGIHIVKRAPGLSKSRKVNWQVLAAKASRRYWTR